MIKRAHEFGAEPEGLKRIHRIVERLADSYPTLKHMRHRADALVYDVICMYEEELTVIARRKQFMQRLEAQGNDGRE